ncbi:Mce protein [uncultured Mycolicibacterium sp.]|uniref:Mce protein n=1 Tax=uncultured Mycolicibacterium sp. TaxID=2320817 RepID=UPI0026366276|nr:Mce protein [uncultured Mycolicibacterium sp.]
MSVSTDEDRDTDVEETTEVEETTAEAVTETDERTEPGPQQTTATARPGRRSVLLGSALAAVVLLLVVAVGYLGWQLSQERRLDAAAEAARQAATEYAQILTSIDSDRVDENFRAVLDGATGEFKDLYSQSSTELRQLLIDNKAKAHGVVLESAVQSVTPDQAVVLLFVDQSVTNTNLPDPRIDRSRIKMTMEYVDGRWRASKVELP